METKNDDIQETPTLITQLQLARRFSMHYSIFQIVGILILLSVYFWLQHFRGGYGFSEIIQICNWHPLLMAICFIFLFANSILHFRNFRHVKKQLLKRQHAILHICIIILASLGIWAGLNSNSIANPPIPRFYSLHSWLGIVTIVVYFVQFVTGFWSFLYPEIDIQRKEIVMPCHIIFGTLTFALAVVTTVLGFSEKIVFVLNQRNINYIPTEALILNILVIVLIFYSALVVYMVLKPEYKRSPIPEDGALHTANVPI